MNKKTIAILLIALTSGMAARAAQVVVESQRGPESPIELPYFTPTVITSVHLPCRGKWIVTGGATIQANAAPAQQRAFLYSVATFTDNPNQFPSNGMNAMDARPYGTWWFSADPRPTVIQVDYDNADVYLLVEYYGQFPADFVQAFGSIVATVDIP